MNKRDDLVGRIRWLSDRVGGVSALARAADISRTTLQGILTRGEPATDKTLAALAGGTGVSLEYLAQGGARPKVLQDVRIRAKNVADMAPLGLRRPKPGSPVLVLGLVGARVSEALAKANPDVLAASIPPAFAAAYSVGIALPGPAHRAAIAAAAGVSEAWLLGEDD
jgi:transcriptional regulator with XRE-family HTH domain